MSGDNLEKKPTILLHNCIINDERYDLVITPHRQTIGYIRTKRQTLGKKILCKQKQIFPKRFSKQRNAVSDSETSAIQELHNLKDSIKKTFKMTINYTSRTQKPRHQHQSKENVGKKVIRKQNNTSFKLDSTNNSH